MEKKRKSNAGKIRGIYVRHGHAKGGRTPEYRIWSNIKSRCYNDNYKDFPGYGGRGIVMSEEWKDNYLQFFKDMGSRPSPKHQIDRINNSLGYSASNCRWVTCTENANNTRRSVRIHIREKSYTIKEICLKYSLQRELIKAYVQRKKTKGIVASYTEAFLWVCAKYKIDI